MSCSWALCCRGDNDMELDLKTGNFLFFTDKMASTKRLKKRSLSRDFNVATLHLIIRKIKSGTKDADNREKQQGNRIIKKHKTNTMSEQKQQEHNSCKIVIMVSEKEVGRSRFKGAEHEIKYKGDLIESLQVNVKRFIQNKFTIIDILQPIHESMDANQQVKFRETQLLKEIFRQIMVSMKGLDRQMKPNKRESNVTKSNIRLTMQEDERENQEKVDICINWADFDQKNMTKEVQILVKQHF